MLKFDVKYLYGVEEIDIEHVELIQRAETLMDAYQNGNPEREILKLLKFLQNYVHYHFENEEALQQKYDYPDFETHHQIHEEFKNNMENLYADILDHGLTLENRLHFNHLCSEWIAHHIGEEDKKLSEYILIKKQRP